MIDFLRHATGLCCEPHPSLLTVLASLPIIGYYINRLRNKLKNKNNEDN